MGIDALGYIPEVYCKHQVLWMKSFCEPKTTMDAQLQGPALIDERYYLWSSVFGVFGVHIIERCHIALFDKIYLIYAKSDLHIG
jgi:hypothetical protein